MEEKDLDTLAATMMGRFLVLRQVLTVLVARAAREEDDPAAFVMNLTTNFSALVPDRSIPTETAMLDAIQATADAVEAGALELLNG